MRFEEAITNPKNKYRWSYQKVKVRVNEYMDGNLGVFHGSRCLARYHADGKLLEDEIERKRMQGIKC